VKAGHGRGGLKKEEAVEKGRGGAHQKTEATPPSADAWVELERNLAVALADLENDAFLIVASKAEHYFVQFAGQGQHGMRAEAVSNTFIRPEVQLSETACRDLVRLGWKAPTYVPTKGVGEPADGSPNYYLEAATPVPHARLAALAVQTLRRVYRVRHPGELTYKAFAEDKTSIRFPLLKVQRVAATPANAGAEAPANQGWPVGAMKDPSGVPAFVLPDGRPISADEVEADLRARITTAEEALEGAVWQLARFYSAVGRHADATTCVERCLANTRDPAKHAAGCLGLGQLLEQQNRYAEAEAVYARGLEFPAASATVSYLLHNNRGYCLNLLGRHAEAEFHTRAAIAIDPTRHNAHKNLGLALAGQGRLGEAARYLLEADCRCPQDGRARQHLADLLAENPEVLDADPALAAACRERGIRPGRAGSA
jgi:tetratricopeptide (TPR) repeat protein